MRYTALLTLVFACVLTAGCSDSGNGGSLATDTGDTSTGSAGTTGTGTGTTGTGTTSSGGTTGSDGSGSGETTGAVGSTTGGTSSTGGDGGGTVANVSLLDAGLSHVSTPTPALSATANDPLVSEAGRNRLASLSDSLAVMFEVVSNQGTSTGLDCSAIGAQYNSCSVVNLHLKDADGSLNDSQWKLFFHSTRRILRIESDEFSAAHVNGDLHYLAPTAAFSGFSGDIKSIKLITEYNHLVETDFQPRYWIARGGDAQLIANTDSETDETAYAMEITGNNRFEFVGETNLIATPQTRLAENSTTTALAAGFSAADIQARIVPSPSSITLGNGMLDISGGFSFAGSGLSAPTLEALQSRQATFMSTAGAVNLSAGVDASLPINSYNLVVNGGGIDLAASNETMLFHAAQSLLGLVEPGNGSIPYVTISDSPRFEHRGVHIDVARNFHSVSSMKKLIDQMAAYKLNKLHLHLSDDEGWRLQIPALPELTTVAGTRQFNVDAQGNVSELGGLMPAMGSGPNANNQGSGFYSRAEFVDLLRYAAARYIDVIPEIDMPAHARAAVVAMRARAFNAGNGADINIRLDDPNDTSRYLTVQNYNDSFINPCVPGTYAFIDTVVGEVKAMYTEAGLSLDVWHMGGDEAVNIFKGFGFNGQDTSAYDFPWERSPVCESFIANTDGVNSRDDLTRFFIQRVAQIVAAQGVPRLYAFQDIYDDLAANELATEGAGVGFWAPITSGSGIDDANSFSNRGFETVISVPDFLYFDFPYEVDPQERGYYWATRRNGTQKVFSFAPENLPQNAQTSVSRYGDGWSGVGQTGNQGYFGMQASLWSETVRTPQHFDYMLFPRLLAHAERSWHRADWELEYVPGQSFSNGSGPVDTNALNADYALFAAALGRKELAKLDAAGVLYRVPLPGGSTANGVLDMNIGLPGLPLEFSTDGNTYQAWNAASPPASAQFVRARSADGSRAGRAAPLQ